MFFIFYFTYGAAHFYAFFKIKSAFQPNTATTNILLLILIFLAVSPHLIHLYSHRGLLIPARIAAYTVNIWMSLLFLFISISIPLEAYNLLIRLTGLMLKENLTGIMLTALPLFFIPVLLSVAFNIYGYFEAKTLHVKRLTVETSKLPVGINLPTGQAGPNQEQISKLTIAHVSDLHLGIIHRGKKLKKVLKEIEFVKPDLIVSTGDFLDGEMIKIDHLAEKLRKTPARLGKIAVTGNHEFYAGIKHSLKFMKEAGFTVLRGEGITIQNLINIAGVDDPTRRNKNFSETTDSEREILSKLPSDIFTLLLKHRPRINKNSVGLFDLQLSGHAHNGQIFPFSLIIKLYFHVFSGHSKLPADSAIHVSGGAGTAGPPIRVFSPPEITIIEVVSKKASQRNIDKRTL